MFPDLTLNCKIYLMLILFSLSIKIFIWFLNNYFYKIMLNTYLCIKDRINNNNNKYKKNHKNLNQFIRYKYGSGLYEF